MILNQREREPDRLSSHPRDIAAFAIEAVRAGQGAALIFVTSVAGGSVRAPGLRMAVAADGRSAGFVSNGCVEADLVATALAAIAAGRPIATAYGRHSGRFDIRLPCGGRIDLLVAPVTKHNMPALASMSQAERTSANLHLTASGMLIWGSGGKEAAGADWTFAVHPKIRVLAIGSGREALFLARMAAGADMDVQVVSPSESTLDDAMRLGLRIQPLRGLSSRVVLDADAVTAIALMFHDHAWELRILEEALRTPSFYIGALGSMRAHEHRVEALQSFGFSEFEIARIRAPIGLVQRLREPHLLAISVLAELTREFQARFGAF